MIAYSYSHAVIIILLLLNFAPTVLNLCHSKINTNSKTQKNVQNKWS